MLTVRSFVCLFVYVNDKFVYGSVWAKDKYIRL